VLTREEARVLQSPQSWDIVSRLTRLPATFFSLTTDYGELDAPQDRIRMEVGDLEFVLELLFGQDWSLGHVCS